MGRKNFQVLEAQDGVFNPQVLNLVDLLEWRAGLNPDKLLFTELESGEKEAARITYYELHEKAKQVAAYLQGKFKPGDRSVLIFPAGINFIVGFFGCIYAGIVAVPGNIPRRNQANDRFWSILESSGSKLILSPAQVYENPGSSLQQDTRLKCTTWLKIEDILDRKPQRWKKPETGPEDLAVLQFTSGSTGSPRGVMVTHSNAIYDSEVVKRSFNHDDSMVVVTWLPPFHDMGLFGTMLQIIYAGGSSVILTPNDFLRNPFLWLKAITRYKGTTAGGPNFALDLCSDKVTEEEMKDLDLSSLKVLFCGAEPLKKLSVERFIDKFKKCGFNPGALYPCYGLAESTLMVSGGDHGAGAKYLPASYDDHSGINDLVVSGIQAEKSELVSCGFPWVETKIAIVDPVSRKLMVPGRTGEIWTSGPAVCKGYWNEPGATNETFKASLENAEFGAFLRTGDLGFIHNGHLYITGRLKDLIIIRGQNHYPQDIETTVEMCHEALRRSGCAAFSVEVANEERLVVVQEVERAFMRDLPQDEIFEAIRQAVSEEHEIQVYAILLIRTGSILKTTSGKIQRLACRQAFLQDELNVVASWQMELDLKNAPDWEGEFTQEAVLQWLIDWLSAKLKINRDKIDPEKSVKAYGLDSMVAVELERDVNSRFGIKWSVADFLVENKISDLAREGFCLLREKEKK